MLAGKTLIDADAAFEVTRSLPHGHAAAVHAMARTLGFPALLGPPGPHRDLAYALVISRVLRPGFQAVHGRLVGRRDPRPGPGRGGRLDR